MKKLFLSFFMVLILATNCFAAGELSLKWLYDNKAGLSGSDFTGDVSITGALTSTVGSVPFLVDKTNCFYFTRFQGNATDIVNGTFPTYNSSLIKYYQDNFVSDSTTKGTVTNSGFTLCQYEGDTGKFGYGMAVEEQRTNYATYSIGTNATGWQNNEGTMTVSSDYHYAGHDMIKWTGLSSGPYGSPAPITLPAVTSDVTLTMIIKIPNGYVPTNDNCGAYINESLGDWTSITNLGNNFWRMVCTRNVLPAESKIYGFGIENPFGARFDTIYFAHTQVEVGSFPTSYIATDAAAVTRQATFLELPTSVVNPSVGSVSFWVKPRFIGNTQDNEAYFLNIGTASTVNNSIAIRYHTDEKFYFTQGVTGAHSLSSTVPTSFSTGGWTHIILTWSGTTYTAYVNGVSLGAISDAEAITNFVSPKCYIGKYFSDGASKPNFIMSDLAIMKTALTAAQVKQIYSGGIRCNAPIISGEVPNTIKGSVGFSGAWDNYDGTATFQKVGNTVKLHGLLVGDISGVTTFVLPSGYRPAVYSQNFSTLIKNSDGSYGSARAYVALTSGEVQLIYDNAGPTFIGLDNIQFEAAQ